MTHLDFKKSLLIFAIKSYYMKKPNRERKNEIKYLVSLNEEQREAQRLIRDNQIVIITGRAGSGKSLVSAQVALDFMFQKQIDEILITRAAIEVGKRLHNLAQHSQVIVVTHLPQVAAWADTHFVVKKSSDGSVVQSGVLKLGQSERVEEIARMLAGLEESSSAREHAAELLAMRG